MAEVAVAEEYRCFVGGLAWATDDRGLSDAFKSFGDVIESKVINDRETGRSRGFGFVTFRDEQSMRDAIESMNGKDLDGRSITVHQAQQRPASTGFKSNGGRFGGNDRGYSDRGARGYGGGAGDRGYGGGDRGGYGGDRGGYGGNDRGYGGGRRNGGDGGDPGYGGGRGGDPGGRGGDPGGRRGYGAPRSDGRSDVDSWKKE